MGSLIMHLYASEKIRKKYGFGDMFLAGALLPDIRKLNGEDKTINHFLVERRKNRVSTILPEVDDYIFKSKSEENIELRYGYIAHLIEDKIWFKNYIGKYCEVIGVDSNNDDLLKYNFKGDKVIRTKDEFLSDLYGDYKIWNLKLKEKYNVIDTSNVKKILVSKNNLNELTKNKMETYLDNNENSGHLKLISEEDMNEYFNKCIDEVCEKINKLIEI